ncbi:DUF4190 domain-containing protein [Brevibacterium sp. FME37]|uniref:DUF4190 domain-containing protein n=1 Tax=Brevibacterium sp. FME37 TaxID=2742607 RepID=UPI0018675350|nr:DUF4190 domain-containing protein [Brevibacterium sp. FME37]
MHTLQLPASGINAASSSGYSHGGAQGGYPSYSAHSNPAAYGPNPGFAGLVTYVYQPIVPTNTLAIIGMVMSLIGAFTSFVPAGIVGIVMGHVARKQIRQRGERGDAMAVTALWAGYLGVGFWLIFWGLHCVVVVLAIAAGAAEGSY